MRVSKINWLLCLVLSCLELSAQRTYYGYEWIAPNVEYFKLLVAQDGVYRVKASEINRTNWNPNNIHLMFRGVEQPLRVINTGNMNQFDSNDYIEFFGQKLDGADDEALYKATNVSGVPDPSSHSNPYQSLFTDTAAYFLYADDLPGKRFDYFYNNQFSNYPLATSYRKVDIINPPTSSYLEGGGGSYNNETNLNSDYTSSEGWIEANATAFDMYFTTSAVANTDASAAVVEVRIAGVSSGLHKIQLSYKDITSPIFEFYNYKTVNCSLTIPAEKLDNGVIAVKIRGTNGNEDRFCIFSRRLSYDRNFEFSGANSSKLEWIAKGSSNTTFRLKNFSVADSGFILDLTNQRFIRGNKDGVDFQAVIPKSDGQLKLFAYSDLSVLSPVIRESSIAGLNSPDQGAEYVIVTHRKLAASAKNYANYRDTASVNKFKTKVVYVDQIYDEFGFGSVTPLAIKRFVHTALNRWNIKPQYLLLWGKATNNPRNYPDANLVPTWGFPPSDFEFVSNFGGGAKDLIPVVYVGRVSCKTDPEGEHYLAKVREHEYSAFAPWMKRGVHLGGGSNLSEQTQIGNFLQAVFAPIFTGPPFGGEILYNQKTTTGIADGISGAEVREAISSGVSLITFFGHSTSNIFDIEILPPYSYDNFGKYPLIIANGCYAGKFVEYPGISFGEQFILEPRRGSIAYLSSTSAGFMYPLGEYTRRFYEISFRDSLGIPLGRAVAGTIRRYFTRSPDDWGTINHCKDINLQGDPAVRLAVPTRPDLALRSGDLSLGPAGFSAQSDSLILTINARNYGLALTDSFYIKVRQVVQNTNTVIEYPLRKYPPFSNSASFNFVIYRATQNIAGPNTFEVTLDAPDSVPEMNEQNNKISTDFFLPSNAPAILYPWDFAIVNTDTLLLQAAVLGATQNLPAQYIFEIDTSYRFNSPKLQRSGIVNGTTLICRYKLPFNLENHSVYYWRVRLANENRVVWTNASFKYIAGPSEGWAQSRAPQFFDNPTRDITMDRQAEKWQFEPVRRRLRADISFGRVIYSIDGITMTDQQVTVRLPGILYAVIDGSNYKPLTFSTDIGFMDWIQNSDLTVLVGVINNMKPNDYLLVLGNGASAGTFTEEIYKSLASIGVSDAIRQLGNGTQFILLGRKGDPVGLAREVLSPNTPDGSYLLEHDFFMAKKSGKILSKLIGPGLNWQDFFWNWEANDGADKVNVNLYGVRPGKPDSLLLSNLPVGNYNLSNYSTREFPQLKLEALVSDSAKSTAPQLMHWHVFYTPVPDVLADPEKNFTFQNDTVPEGQTIRLTCTARNLTTIPMDSLLVSFQVTKADRSVIEIGRKRYAPIPGNGEIVIAYEFGTQGLGGLNQLTIVLNPDYDQPERNPFNNLIFHTFRVIDDKINPILDVTFDGKRMVDGDITGPNPQIQIEVTDENPFAALDDTSAIEIYLKPADQVLGTRRYFFADGGIEFFPATLPNNRARAIFKPGPLANGEYVLEVQSFDKKRNASGKTNYRIRFKVIKESTITQILNYPNPFSSHTRFVYTLTGTELPEVFYIDIYTITGKFVKRIDFKANGDIGLGNYISKTTWDGTDEFGDRLANGVYLYRVHLKLPGGKEIETVKQNAGDETARFFENGWGKMYLMR